jgi:hypothetical protein
VRSVLLALPLLVAVAVALLPGAARAAVAPAVDGVVRVAAEAGPSWIGGRPDVGPGVAAAIRLRVQPHARVLLGAGLVHQVVSVEGGTLGVQLVPVTAGLRLDRAPIAPFIAGGVAWAHLDGAVTLSGALEAGLEAHLTDRLAATAQASYYGFAGADAFPVFSSLGLGLEVTLF